MTKEYQFSKIEKHFRDDNRLRGNEDGLELRRLTRIVIFYKI